MSVEALAEIIANLGSRPGHEKVRAHLHTILTQWLGAKTSDIDFERQIPEVRGRIDALLGRTVFEIKSDLRRERKDADAQLLRYLPQREKETGATFVGIETDGADFAAYTERGGRLIELGAVKSRRDNPRALIGWLESVVLLNDELAPDVETIHRELGREGVHYHRSLTEIERVWGKLENRPAANLKRDLWNRLLRIVYGADVGVPDLFFQHTYLTIVAKSIATLALMDKLPHDGAALLSGQQFRNLSIFGAVESDFFDWLLMDPLGEKLVMEIARHVNRFRLHQIDTDILKVLYENLIDPTQRHDLGEYYTPDWLADRICKAAITRPLEDRVIDPACGSGTFLFHAIRRLLTMALSTGMSHADAVALACEKIAGIDVHPVAVIFARATFLLALMPSLTKGRPSSVSVPVYLGDALQWNAREFMNQRDLEIVVPAKENGKSKERVILRFPVSIATEPNAFDATLNHMLELADRDQAENALEGWLGRHTSASGVDVSMLLDTYRSLKKLQREGRNHIWGYVARNLSRPIWLATDRQRANVVIGNPPWLDYKVMSPAVQDRFREEMVATGIWQKGVHGVHFDLSAYFFARSVYLYMRREGRIAFVMPYAAMTRKSYAAFLTGRFKARGYTEAQVHFSGAWVFPWTAKPIFPVPSCVLFAERSVMSMPLPNSVHAFQGELPRRDAHASEADQALTETTEPWPTSGGDDQSYYQSKFRAGAKLDPRRLILVKKVEAGRLGGNPSAPVVRGRTGTLDKPPWKDVKPPEGAVEAEFIRPVLLGESIGPYRIFGNVLAVIPWTEDKRELLNSNAAARRGFSHLAAWLSRCEKLWDKHGKGKTSFQEKLDYYKLLTIQFPTKPLRVAYSKSGVNLAAVLVQDKHAIIDHMLYWAAVENEKEGRYLTAILNSETIRSRASKWQSQGQWGARHFDKVAFNLPIPKFDPSKSIHRDLEHSATEAEKIAAKVHFEEEEYFTRSRKRIREALNASGCASRIDTLVERLLG
jgi:hypothetical protein